MKAFLSLLTFLIGINGFGQERFEVKKIGFSIESPKDWIEMKNDEIISNLEKYDLSPQQLDELLKSNNDAKDLITYLKYDPKKYAGIIPTIKIRTRETQARNISEFLRSIEASNADAKRTLQGFRFIENPVAVKISNEDAVKFTVQFALKTGPKYHQIRSNSYYILRKGYFISLNFIEEPGKDENQPLFEQLIQSLQLTKP